MADFGDGSAGERVLRNFRFTTQDEIALLEPAPVRKVVQISTMVHAEKDWAFVALCDDGSMFRTRRLRFGQALSSGRLMRLLRKSTSKATFSWNWNSLGGVLFARY